MWALAVIGIVVDYEFRSIFKDSQFVGIMCVCWTIAARRYLGFDFAMCAAVCT